jgi:hypothetical protein
MQNATKSVSAVTKTTVSYKWPKVNGKCWQVWQACTAMQATQTTAITVAQVRQHAIANSLNVSNATQEFYRWRKFVAAQQN